MNKNRLFFNTFFFILIWVVLYLLGRYNMFVNEQEQLFQWSWKYAGDLVGESGGFSILLSEFFVQFYHIPLLGTFVAAILIFTAVWVMYRILFRICGGGYFSLMIMALVPIIPLIKSLCVNQGTAPLVAYLLVISVLYGVLCCRSKYQWLLATIIVMPLYWLSGPAAILFPLMYLAGVDYKNGKDVVKSVIPALLFAIIGYLGLRGNIIGSFQSLVSPSFYILRYREADGSILTSWIISLSSMLVVRIAYRYLSKWMGIIGVAMAVSLSVIIILCVNGAKYKVFTRWSKEHYLYVEGRYDDLLKSFSVNPPQDLIERNYINLSLLRSDKFLDDFFKYSPSGHLSILSPWADVPFPTLFLWSEMTSMMGNIAKSQQSAFEGNILSGPRGGAMYMKNLAELYIIRGEYDIAERYISQLEKSLFYHSWARSERKYLNDKAVESDHYLVTKRRCLISDARTLATVDELEHMILVAKNNPDHKTSMQIAGIMTLSAGALPQFSYFLMNLYKTKALPVLPPVFQDGALVCFANPEIIKGFGIPQQRIMEYNMFKKTLTGNKQSITTKAAIEKYKDSVWYYLAHLKENLKHNKPVANDEKELPTN